MVYKYSSKFKEQMESCGLTADEVGHLFRGDVESCSIAIGKDGLVRSLLGYVNKKGVVLFVDHNRKRLIAVRNMTESDKIVFNEKVIEYCSDLDDDETLSTMTTEMAGFSFKGSSEEKEEAVLEMSEPEPTFDKGTAIASALAQGMQQLNEMKDQKKLY